jgi:hypothetical protein
MQIMKIIAAGVLLVMMMVVVACGSAPAPTTEPTQLSPTAENAPVQQTAEPTAPATSEAAVDLTPVIPAAYPGPFVQYVAPDPYPAPVEGEQIEWTEVEAMLISGQVAEVFQRLSLPVVITLKDGRILLVESPAKDEIFKLLDQCGEKCNDVRRLSDY